jgi:hypothetical protein
MNVRTVAWALAAGLLVCGNAHALYVGPSRWPAHQGIPVCWAPNLDPEQPIAQKIRVAVEDTWGRYSSIWFEGWGNCPAPSPGLMPDGNIIYIMSIDGIGPSGTDFGPKVAGSNPPHPRPTEMRLNGGAISNALCDLGPGGNSHEECVIWMAVHEFGHALGFLHEHARRDFTQCPKSVASPTKFAFHDKREGGGTNLTTYDENSVMNYCSSDGNNDGQLTWKDVAGLQAVYGMKPRGSIVGPGGRCADVDNRAVAPGSQVSLWHCWGGDNQRWAWDFVNGTFTPNIAFWGCLDDPGGGRMPGIGMFIWDCNSRENPRWNFDQFYIKTFGDKCLDTSQGKAFFTGCRFGSEFQWTYTAEQQLKRFGVNRCLVFGGVGSQPVMADCDANNFDQKVRLAGSGYLYTNREFCLEVPDRQPFTMDRLPIRIAECDTSKLTQQFYFRGFMKSSTPGMCMTTAPATVPRNGVRVIVDSCTAVPFWEYYAFN